MLPRQLTSFVGRHQELSDLTAALKTHHLVTICGPGGVGKTRMALATAEEVGADYPGGVFLADMADVTDQHLVASSVASALGVRERPEEEVLVTLAGALGSRRVLIVLENCEHQTAACHDLALTLLQRCPGVQLLASSREPLGVPGELAWRLPRLPTPPAGTNATPQLLGQYDSVRLFIERARSFQATFALDQANATAVAQICTLTEGIPLAIELAAGRLTTLSVEQMADQLSNALHVLSTNSAALPARQRTLRATLDWSYERLGVSEMLLFTRLSVFSGLASLAAVRAVCSDAALPEVEVLDNLARLIDKSLLQAEATRGELRYRLLELPRQYAMEKLTDCELADLGERHGEYFASLAELSEEKGLTDLDEWISRLEDERQNFRAALVWSLSHDQNLALRLAGGLAWFWHMRSNLVEGRRWLQQVLAQPGGNPALRARALRGAAQIVYRQGDCLAAQAFLSEALPILRDLGNEPEAARVLRTLGLVLLSLSHHEAANLCLEEALAIELRLGLRVDSARTVGSLALVAIDDGRFQAAAEHLANCIAIARSAGDAWGLATSIGVQGELALEMGDHEAASSHLGISIGVLGRLNDANSVAYRLEGFARLAAARSQHERALTLAAAAAAIRARVGAVAAPHWRRRLEMSMAQCNSQVPPHRGSAAESRGIEMTLEDAISYAMEADAQSEPRSVRDRRLPAWASSRSREAGLSAREWDVLALVLTGLSNRLIASRLTISQNTVNKHVASILAKLRARSRAQAIAIVLGLELTP